MGRVAGRLGLLGPAFLQLGWGLAPLGFAGPPVERCPLVLLGPLPVRQDPSQSVFPLSDPLGAPLEDLAATGREALDQVFGDADDVGLAVVVHRLPFDAEAG